KNLSAGTEITDEFTVKIGENEKSDVFTINEEEIEILQVNSFDNLGNPGEDTTDAKDLFEINVVGNKVTYTLKEAADKAFIFQYKTKAEDGAYITDNGSISNAIKINGELVADSSQDVDQQVGIKKNSGINYEDKTIDWTITVNADKQDLRNFVLTDDFSGSGQKLVPGTINIEP